MPADAPDEPAAGLVLRGTLVLPGGLLEDGALVVQGGRITWVGPAAALPPGADPGPPPPGTLVLPGLVDLHCHGGGGAGFPEATTLEEVARAAHEHLRHGTTTLVASLVTAPVDELLARTALLAEAVEAGLVAGIHLEGPFLSPARCGAQRAADMRPGDPRLVRDLAAAARGHLVTMTVAPEVAGVTGTEDDVLRALVEAGALPSVGHTDGSAEQTEEAVRRTGALLAATAGARSARPTATHLWNAMRPPHHRDPGPVTACLGAAARGELVVELVADGTHLAPATVRAVLDLVGPDGVALVTDAIAAAGVHDGDYPLGPVAVRVADGVARVLARDDAGDLVPGAIAGGVAHLLDVVRTTVAAGVPLVTAVRAAATTPARVLGRDDLGALEPGRRADALVTTADLTPVRVVRGGVPVE